jgi:protein TonB
MSLPTLPVDLPREPSPRTRSLPALGLPASREKRRGSTAASILLHVLIIALALYTPTKLHEGIVIEQPQGSGGPGPAGGGGGGRRGTGGDLEKLRFVQVAPAPAQPAVSPPPEVIEPPKPVLPPPEPVKPQEPLPEIKPELKVAPVPVSVIASVVPGVGGGSGRDGTAGSGPGSGGGVGTGIGPGRGSGVGPGTGGGTQANYPPTPTELFIPPLPMPDRVRGFHLVAEYDIDETGKIIDFKFTPTRDKDYNKRLDEVLRSFRFRPGSRPDGTPIRMKAQIIYDF